MFLAQPLQRALGLCATISRVACANAIRGLCSRFQNVRDVKSIGRQSECVKFEECEMSRRQRHPSFTIDLATCFVLKTFGFVSVFIGKRREVRRRKSMPRNQALNLTLPYICVASNTYLRMFKEEPSSSSKVDDHMSREVWWTQRHSLECVNVRTPKYFSQACRFQNCISVPYRNCCATIELYLPKPKRRS